MTPDTEDPSMVHDLIQACVRRSRRLVFSFDELDRDVKETSSRTITEEGNEKPLN